MCRSGRLPGKPNKRVWPGSAAGKAGSHWNYFLLDKASGEVAGSTRFYGYEQQDDSILIGYTFYATRYWGKGLNLLVKGMMLDYIFPFVSQVYFHIGAANVRSQMAIGRLGAEKIDEQLVTYFGEAPKLNFVYRVGREEWGTYRAQHSLATQ